MKKNQTAPEELQDAALLAWEMFHERIGEVADSDRAALLVLSQAWAEMQDAERHIQKDGAVIEFRGTPYPNPFTKIRDKARSTVNMLMKEFQLTPLSRAKSSPKKKAEDDPVRFDF